EKYWKAGKPFFIKTCVATLCTFPLQNSVLLFCTTQLVNMDSTDIVKWMPRKSEFDRIKNQIDSMNTDQLNEVFEDSLIKSSDILTTDKETTVCIFPGNDRTPYDMVTIGSGKIAVFYMGFDRYFKSGMAHEYHHSVWMEKHFSKNNYETGLDYLMVEGQAVMFETFVFPDLNSSYLVVDDGFNNEYWSKVEPYLENSLTGEFQDMAINGTHGFPKYYCYSEGYKMIRSYLNLYPDMTVEEWTSKSPKEIFEESNYIANYQLILQ
ncbi:DUF2268 domain-containing putative Zn-dependent protease, partial [Sporosarcina contaminans]